MTRNPQAALDFGVVWDSRQAFKSSMRALNDAYDSVGNLVCAGATGIDKGDLPKMFEPGSGRHMRYSAVFDIGKLASLERRVGILTPLAEHYGLRIAEPAEEMPDAEARARLEVALKALGPIGEQAYLTAMGMKR